MDGIEGIEMLNDAVSPKSKSRRKKKSSGVSVSSRKSASTRGSRKSMKSGSKSSKKSKDLRKAMKGSSGKLKIDDNDNDNISVMSDDSLNFQEEGMEDEMSLQSAKSNKSNKSMSSKKSRSKRSSGSSRKSLSPKRGSSKSPKREERSRRSERKSLSPMRSNSIGHLAGKKESRRDKTKRSNSLSEMAAKKEIKRRGSMGSKSGHSRSMRRGSMGSKSGHSRSKQKRSGSHHTRSSTDDDSLGYSSRVAKIDESREYTKDLDLSESHRNSAPKTRHNSSSTQSTASSTSGGSGSAIPIQVEIGDASSKPSSKKIRESTIPLDQLPQDDNDLVEYMKERAAKLDAGKDANAELTSDADQRIDLKEEAELILASADGPAYVEEVILTCNGEKHLAVPVNSLQWYMFRYCELLNDTMDVYDEPKPDE